MMLLPAGRNLRMFAAFLCKCFTAAIFTALAGLLTACALPPTKLPLQENFGSVATYSRLFDATAAQTCEAARRALLSQGYLIGTSGKDLV